MVEEIKDKVKEYYRDYLEALEAYRQVVIDNDKYRCEINKPTTGGVKGYSVRANGDDKVKVVEEALEMARLAEKGIGGLQ